MLKVHDFGGSKFDVWAECGYSRLRERKQVEASTAAIPYKNILLVAYAENAVADNKARRLRIVYTRKDHPRFVTRRVATI
jgi:hypothetical protein